jgi:hypothetical protein
VIVLPESLRFVLLVAVVLVLLKSAWFVLVIALVEAVPDESLFKKEPVTRFPDSFRIVASVSLVSLVLSCV